MGAFVTRSTFAFPHPATKKKSDSATFMIECSPKSPKSGGARNRRARESREME
jgi:hypothetical protein